MNLNDIIHGFKIERIRESAELKGTLYEMRHIKTGAELAFLDNKEDNKLFSVAFKTLPWDDTGVFHILEHSVLSGSDNYPVKEPFLDLLKSSMNTFLNAMTFPDKTVYPVSSRNEQDFINLTRVYLDAVFRPAIYHNESIFRQEGWHYEVEDGKPSYNGVVFNEMKGALSSVDGLSDRVGRKYLFPNSIYGFESGGDPESIPDLTYESFLSAHSEFYSPTNAKFYLDGDVPLDRVLTVIDEEYLQTFEYNDKSHTIEYQTPAGEQDITSYYEIGKEESEENKAYVTFSKIFATWEQRPRIMAYSLISSYLTDSNESPLKRAILEKGLAQDVVFYVEDGIAQPFYSIVFKNTEESKKDEIKAVYTDVLNRILEKGIDKEELTAYFNQFEFQLRETEEPAGLVRNIYALNSWLYCGDLMLYLENNDILKEMREAIKTDYYDKILAELLSFENTLTLTMLPSKTKGGEDRKREEERVNAEYFAFDEAQKKEIEEAYNKMRLWQDTPDSPEAKKTLPVLSLSDVDKTPMWLETEEKCGSRLLFHKLDTNGIVHCNMYFSIADEGFENLFTLSLICDLLSVLPTEKHTSPELQKEIKKTIGYLDFNAEAYPVTDNPLSAKPMLCVSFSVIENNLDSALELIREILLETKFENKKIIKENVLQSIETLYHSFMSMGHSFAVRRALSQSSASAYIAEKCKGYDFLCALRAFADSFDEKAEAFIRCAEAVTKSVFTSSRLIISETAEAPHSALEGFITSFPQGEIKTDTLFAEPKEPVKEAILVPAGVSFAAYGANIRQYGFEYSGMTTVAATLLTYGYLWNEIRVHGGAYGCGFRCAASGNTTFHSFRDPSPLNSVKVYKNTADFIRQFVDGDDVIDKYIISSIASTEALMSPARQGVQADVNYLIGFTYEDKLRIRTQMLNLKKEKLLLLCDLFEKMKNGNSVCIVGNEDALSETENEYNIYRL